LRAVNFGTVALSMSSEAVACDGLRAECGFFELRRHWSGSAPF
jgi:hypothetical protein